MANEYVQIVAVEDDTVWVKCQTQSACQSCSAKSSCGTSVLAKAFPVRTQELGVKVEPAHQFQVGQTVELTVTDNVILSAAFQVYLLPLLGLLLGAVLLPLIVAAQWAELSSIIGGAAGLILGLWFAKTSYKRAHTQHQVSIKAKSETL